MQNVTGPGVPAVEFCGERVPIPAAGLTIGRAADLVLDSRNRFMHRVVLQISAVDGWWFMHNVGRHLAVDAVDTARTLEVVLGPGASLPLTARTTTVRLSAGSTRYEFDVCIPAMSVCDQPVRPLPVGGDLTDDHLPLTPEQKLLVVVLAEQTLREGRPAALGIPTSAEAARRLGWTITKFNRKLDNVCYKLSGQGVRGLHGDVANLAFRRRSRLVEYCVRAQLVTQTDLATLEAMKH